MHVDNDLSAYIDGELATADHARVQAHLETCDRCRSRLGELRATASLIGALPAVRPSRSLVPSLAPRFNWLRPVRSFSAVASGAFLFVFLLTAIGRSASGLGGGGPTSFITAPQYEAPAAAPAATAAPTQLPAPAAAPTAAAGAAQVATAAPKTISGASVPPTAADAARTAEAFSANAPQRTALGNAPSPSPLTDPFLWLGLAVIATTIAIAAHWRLRTT